MIPLPRAMLCLEDEVVYDGAAGVGCPLCGSAHTWPLAKWLNRPRPTMHLTMSPGEVVALSEMR